MQLFLRSRFKNKAAEAHAEGSHSCEGTGRSLSLKLLTQLEEESRANDVPAGMKLSRFTDFRIHQNNGNDDFEGATCCIMAMMILVFIKIMAMMISVFYLN